jgi:asparagine synthase (glutamine-hydrolysing)
MCGIAGVSGLDGDAAREAVAAMLAALAHRGPDDAGQWFDPDAGLALGHRRLSIIDTSAAGHQPMASAHGRYVLTYNGEIYNFAELRTALEREGAAPAWRGHSDTEVLLAGFEAWGVEDTLRRCNGLFALAVWDRAQQELLLARDRMGEKPLYLGWVGGRFCFASELKAFIRLPGWQARLAPAAIAGFLRAGYVRGAQSAVEGVFRLPPGTVLALPASTLGTPRDWAWLAARLER